MVAVTRHDFLSKNSCSDAIFIRKSLLKNIERDISDKKCFGHYKDNLKFCAGIICSEAHKSAADQDRFVLSGWASSAGALAETIARLPHPRYLVWIKFLQLR